MKNKFDSIATERISTILKISPENRTQEQLETIMAFTKDIHFLSKISEENNSSRIHWEFCRLMTLEVYNAEDFVVKFGETGEKFYAIVAGSVSVLVPTKKKPKNNAVTVKNTDKNRLLRSLSRHNTEKNNFLESVSSLRKKKTMIDFDFLNEASEVEEMIEVKILKKGDSFGELALLNNTPRTATVKCREKTVFAVLSRRNFQRILGANSKKEIIEIFEYLKIIPAFSDLPQVILKNLSYFITQVTLKKNQVLFEDTKKNKDFAYFIKSGEFKIIVTEVVYSNNDSGSNLLKLGMKKNFNKTVQYDIVVKGKNEIIGDEIIIDEGTPFWHKCECISNFGVVYILNVKVYFK